MISRVRALAACASVLYASSALAQADAPELPQPIRETPRERASVWLRSSDEGTRILGLERLAAIGDPQSLAKLIDVVDTTRFDRTRLFAVRLLAPRAGEDRVQAALVRLLFSSQAESEGAVPEASSPERVALRTLTRETAALALAREGSERSRAVLVRALSSDTPLAWAASAALVAYPPPSFAPWSSAREKPSFPLTLTLARLPLEHFRGPGAPHATLLLREAVVRGDDRTRLAAMAALVARGDSEAREVAEYWAREGKRPALRIAATRALVRARAPGAVALVRGLLEDAATRRAGLELARRGPDPRLREPLFAALERREEDALLALDALAALADEPSVERLARECRHANMERAGRAAVGLGLAPGRIARRELAALLNDPRHEPARRRLLVRAAVVRAFVFEDEVSSLVKLLEALQRSSAAPDREVGSFGLAALDRKRAESLATSRDAAWARGALAAPAVSAAHKAAGDLIAPVPGLVWALPLTVPLVADAVPTSLLASWFGQPPELDPVVTWALAARDEERVSSWVLEAAHDPRPSVRTALALGLARSRREGVPSELVALYRFELDAGVRLAIVSALSERAAPGTRVLLEGARNFDPDARVRGRAGRALAAWAAQAPSARVRRSGEPGFAVGVRSTRALVWERVTTKPGRRAGVNVELPSGLVVPCEADADGWVVRLGIEPVRVSPFSAAGP
jgi:hypothetical protein